MTRRCSWCGLQVDDDVLFCPRDAKPTGDSLAEPTADERRPSIYVVASGAFKTGQVQGVLGAVLLGLGAAIKWIDSAVMTSELDLILQGRTNYPLQAFTVQGILTVVAAVGSFLGVILARQH